MGILPTWSSTSFLPVGLFMHASCMHTFACTRSSSSRGVCNRSSSSYSSSSSKNSSSSSSSTSRMSSSSSSTGSCFSSSSSSSSNSNISLLGLFGLQGLGFRDVLALSAQQQVLAEGGAVDHLVKGDKKAVWLILCISIVVELTTFRQDEMGAVVRRWYVAAITDDAWWKGWDGKMTPEKLKKICDEDKSPTDLLHKAVESTDGSYLFSYEVKREEGLSLFPISKETAFKCTLGLAAILAGCMCFSTAACRFQRNFR
ncbi:hypothetical protein ACSSS7_002287 [Eimeria intestinalis]